MQFILGYMLALTLSMVAWIWQVNAHQITARATRDTVTAQQATQIIAATRSYLAAQPPGLPSTSASAPAYFGLPTLVGSPGHLFAGYAASSCSASYGCPNPYGQSWQVEVQCLYAHCPAAPLTSNSGPWTAFVISFGGTAIPQAALPPLANQVGADGGNTPLNDAPAGVSSALTVEGAFGGWSWPLNQVYNPGPGHLVCKAS